MTNTRQDGLIEALHTVCGLRSSWLRPEFSGDEDEEGNFYHFLLRGAGGEWFWDGYEQKYLYLCEGKTLDFDEGAEFPRTVQQYYGAEFPLELEPWAASHLNAYILPRYAFLRAKDMSTKTTMTLDTFDDVLCLKKFSAGEAQAIVLELIYKAETTGACLFKPYNHK